MTAYFGLPEDVVFCQRCVISNQRPSSTVEFKHERGEQKETIGFDGQGVCQACRFAELKENTIDWDAREQQLVQLLDEHRRPQGGYDVVVPGSGGKDSGFTAHVLKDKYGMNPLTVTWAPHLYTEIGWQNFQNWMHVGGLDNILFTPNGRLHRILTRNAVINLMHPFQPFIVGQRIIGPLIAEKFGIPLIMYGENQAEYGNDIEENFEPKMDRRFFSAQTPEELILGGRAVDDYLADGEFTIGDFTPYIPPTVEDLEAAGVEVHYLGYYMRWDPQECYYYAVENTGFQANSERTEGTYSKYSSIDDKIDMFHYYTTYVKFGIGRATYDASQEIRNGKITREEGVRLVHRYDHEFPTRYYDEFLDYISMTDEEFRSKVDEFRSPHLWEKREGEWFLKQRVE